MAADSIGATLRAERLRRGKDMAAIAAETKICVPILEALESDRFDCMPSGSYRRSFLRQYARALGMDEDEAVTVFQQQYEEPPVALPAPPKRRPFRHLSGVACLLLAATAFAGLYKVAESGLAERKSAAITPPPVPSARPQGEAAKAVSQGEAARAVSQGETARAVSEDTPTAPVRVGLTVTEPVWVSVKCDGNPKYTGVLAPAENRTFEASVSVIVLIGNAGGLAISLNGKPVGPIGGHGETLTLELTPSGVRRLPRRPGPPITDGTAPEA